MFAQISTILSINNFLSYLSSLFFVKDALRIRRNPFDFQRSFLLGVPSWIVNTEVAFTERYLGVIDGYARYI